MRKVSDLNILSNIPLPAPALLLHEIARSDSQEEFVADARRQIREILFHADRRLLLIVGPCSIHDVRAGLEYAGRLRKLIDRVGGRLLLVMRCYFEKPRTSVGWKGLIMDPHLDGTDEIPEGLRIARRLLRDIIDMGVPTATELLDPFTPQYIADLICWSAIGALARRNRRRTAKWPRDYRCRWVSRTRRWDRLRRPSIRSRPRGSSRRFWASAATAWPRPSPRSGNPDCHLVLRGGDSGPNYSAEHVADAEKKLAAAGLEKTVIIDCSHGNSGKDPNRQAEVLRAILSQRAAGNQSIVGAMLESNLLGGSQPFPVPREKLVYGQSITDGCIDWQTTERLVLEAAEGA